MSEWEAVIGLEVHAQLKTEAKLFSSAPNAFGGEPNSQTTEVDIGLPGVLPVINGRAVELAVRAALGLECEIQPESRFARKHYFYPDLPKGYQISQYAEPYALGGAVPAQIDGELVKFPLTRIHMEEDAAKSKHDGRADNRSEVNLNRAGCPLIEIVSEPDLRTPEQAGAYLRGLRASLRALEVSGADMEKGQFRCDANVSVRPRGQAEFGTKVELKNLNSFRFVEKAIAYEIERQVELIEDGGEVQQETRHWDESTGKSLPGRSKEDADDYRYFPDPDLAPLRLDRALVERIRGELPELPHQKRERFQAEFGIPAADSATLAEDREVAQLFEACAAELGDAKRTASFILKNVLWLLGDENVALSETALTASRLVELLRLVQDGTLTPSSSREVFQEMVKSGEDPVAIMRARGLEAVSDIGELEALAQGVIDANPKQLEQFRGGETKLINFFIGQVMKQTQGKASPDVVREVMQRLLGS